MPDRPHSIILYHGHSYGPIYSQLSLHRLCMSLNFPIPDNPVLKPLSLGGTVIQGGDQPIPFGLYELLPLDKFMSQREAEAITIKAPSALDIKDLNGSIRLKTPSILDVKELNGSIRLLREEPEDMTVRGLTPPPSNPTHLSVESIKGERKRSTTPTVSRRRRVSTVASLNEAQIVRVSSAGLLTNIAEDGFNEPVLSEMVNPELPSTGNSVETMLGLIAAIPHRHIQHNVFLQQAIQYAEAEVDKLEAIMAAEKAKTAGYAYHFRVTFAQQKLLQILLGVWNVYRTRWPCPVPRYHITDIMSVQSLITANHYMSVFYGWQRIMESGQWEKLYRSSTLNHIFDPAQLIRRGYYSPHTLRLRWRSKGKKDTMADRYKVFRLKYLRALVEMGVTGDMQMDVLLTAMLVAERSFTDSDDKDAYYFPSATVGAKIREEFNIQRWGSLTKEAKLHASRSLLEVNA